MKRIHRKSEKQHANAATRNKQLKCNYENTYCKFSMRKWTDLLIDADVYLILLDTARNKLQK